MGVEGIGELRAGAQARVLLGTAVDVNHDGFVHTTSFPPGGVLYTFFDYPNSTVFPNLIRVRNAVDVDQKVTKNQAGARFLVDCPSHVAAMSARYA